MATIEQLSTALKNADKAGDVQAAKILANEIIKMKGAAQAPAPSPADIPQADIQDAPPPAFTRLSADRATETLSPDFAEQQRREYMNQQSLLARSNRGRQQPQQDYIEPQYGADDIIKQNTATGRQEAFEQKPWYEKLPVAAGDMSRIILSGVTFGHSDKLPVEQLKKAGWTDEDIAKVQAREDDKLEAARGRAGSAAIGGEIAGSLMTGSALAKSGATMAGRFGTQGMTGAKGILARMGLMAPEGAAYGAVDAAGHDRDIATGATVGAIGGAAGSVAADGLGALVTKVSGALKGKPKVPDLTNLKESAKKAYDDAEKAGVVIRPEGMARLNESVKANLADFGYDPALQPRMAVVLDRLEKATAGNITLKGVDTIRKVADAARASLDPSERAIGVKVINQIDDFVGNLKNSDVLAGDAVKGGASLKTARSLWSRVSKNERLIDAMDRADNRNTQNSIQNNLRPVLEKGRGYTPDEKAALKQIIRGSMGQKALRLTGKLAPTGVVSGGWGTSIGAGVGAFLAGPAGAVIGGAAVPAIGTGAKLLADRNIRQGVDALQILVRGGGDAAALKAAQGTLASLSPAQRRIVSALVNHAAIKVNRRGQQP